MPEGSLTPAGKGSTGIDATTGVVIGAGPARFGGGLGSNAGLRRVGRLAR